jgi:hypothetical protein
MAMGRIDRAWILALGEAVASGCSFNTLLFLGPSLGLFSWGFAVGSARLALRLVIPTLRNYSS